MKRTAEQEKGFREGYCEGWVQALDTIWDLMVKRGLSIQAATDLLYDHHQQKLTEWMSGDWSRTIEPPQLEE